MTEACNCASSRLNEALDLCRMELLEGSSSASARTILACAGASARYSNLKTGSSPRRLKGELPRRVRAAASLRERLARPSPTVWLSGQEAAEYVGVSWPTLRQAMIDHAIPHVRLGTLWRIEVAVLDEHLRRLADIQGVGH